MITLTMVLTLNLNPSIFMESDNRIPLMQKYVIPTGIFDAKNTRAAIPVTPPVVIPFGNKNPVHPTEYNNNPNTIIPQSCIS